MVVGAYAMAAHGYPRATGDIDIWIEVSTENSRRVYLALIEFGAPSQHFHQNTFEETGIVLQIGVAPRRIDLITSIDGVDFHNAWKNRGTVELENLRVPIIAREDLVINKLSTGRPKDIIDAERLKNSENG